MAYRPQCAYPPPPSGWIDEEFEYYFDSIDTPSLAIVPSNKVPLQLQPDAEFHLRGIQISGNVGNLAIRFWTPQGEQISQCLVEADRAYAGTVQGAPPVGKLPVALSEEIVCAPGTVLLIDLALL
jgi:hypothetical protein